MMSPHPAGWDGTIFVSLLFSLKKFTNEKSLNHFYIRIGDNLFASSVYEEEISDEESDFQTWEFEYNEAGQLVKMFRSEGDNETTTINYADGNIVNVTQTAPEQDTLAYQISYTNSIMNTAGVMLYDCCFGIDMDEMGLAYYAGLLGKATTCLPQKKSCSEDDEPEQFNWSIGADGYPSKVESQWSQYSFTWGERSSGVQEIIDEKSYQGVKEYYNINGMRQNQPTQGLNIIRNTDGTSSKILLR